MKRVSLTIAAALVLPIVATTAGAQMPPGSSMPGPAAGAGDSTRISNGNRESTSDYNRLVSSGVKTQNVSGDKGKTAVKAGPATVADIKPGAPLRDVKGVPVGTIDSVADQQVVVNTGQTKIGVPLMAFGKDDKGLLLSITAQQFNDAVAKAHARSQAAQQQP